MGQARNYDQRLLSLNLGAVFRKSTSPLRNTAVKPVRIYALPFNTLLFNIDLIDAEGVVEVVVVHLHCPLRDVA